VAVADSQAPLRQKVIVAVDLRGRMTNATIKTMNVTFNMLHDIRSDYRAVFGVILKWTMDNVQSTIYNVQWTIIT